MTRCIRRSDEEPHFEANAANTVNELTKQEPVALDLNSHQL